MYRTVVAGAVALLIAGCGGSSSKPDPTRAAKATATPTSLAAGEACPVSRRHRVSRRFGYALGDGPAYPVGFARGSTLRIVMPGTDGTGCRDSAWGGQKVLWVNRDVEGIIELRGYRLDAPGVVRFDDGTEPPPDVLRFEGTADGWADHPSFTRLQEPGCYAYVVTAPGVKETIVFRALRELGS